MTEKVRLLGGSRASPHDPCLNVGEAYRHRIYQAPTAAVAPARARPRETTAKDTRTSSARFIWIDMVFIPLLGSGAGSLLGLRRRVRTGRCLDSIYLNDA